MPHRQLAGQHVLGLLVVHFEAGRQPAYVPVAGLGLDGGGRRVVVRVPGEIDTVDFGHQEVVGDRAADGDLGELNLLEGATVVVEHHRFQQEVRGLVDPQAITVTVEGLGQYLHDLRRAAGDAVDVIEPEFVFGGQRRDRPRHAEGQQVPRLAFFDHHRLVVRKRAGHAGAGAHHFPGRAGQRDQAFGFAAAAAAVNEPHRVERAFTLIDEHPVVIEQAPCFDGPLHQLFSAVGGGEAWRQAPDQSGPEQAAGCAAPHVQRSGSDSNPTMRT